MTNDEVKTPQQLALEKFGTDWHDNEGVKPVGSGVMVDVMYDSGTVLEGLFSCVFIWNNGSSISKWRIHSDDKDSRISEKEKAFESLMQPMPECSEEIPCHFVDVKDGQTTGHPAVKSPLSTQIGGDHYTKLAIQPMRYSMENGLDALQHTVIKYVTRFRDKNGVEDLEKAKHCIDMLIEFERNKS